MKFTRILIPLILSIMFINMTDISRFTKRYRKKIRYFILLVCVTLVSLISITGCGGNATGGGAGSSAKIYFGILYSTGTSEIVSANADGSGISQIRAFSVGTTPESVISAPNSAYLLFEYKDASIGRGLGFIYTTATSEQVPWLTNVYYPVISNDSNATAYVSKEGSAIKVYAENDVAVWLATSEATYEACPTISAQGNYVAYMRNYKIGIFDGTSNFECGYSMSDDRFLPTFAPKTDTKLAFVYEDSFGDMGIGCFSDCTNEATKAQFTADYGDIRRPLIWSDDEKYIYFSAMLSSGTDFHIYRMRVSDGDTTRLSDAVAPGDSISCMDLKKFNGISALYYIKMDLNTGDMDLCRMNMDGSGKTTLISGSEDSNFCFFDTKNMSF